MVPLLTLLLVSAALGHAWLQLHNRVLLLLRDSPGKEVLHVATFLAMVVAPVLALALFRHDRAVAEALAWHPSSSGARLLFGLFSIFWLAGIWRGGRHLAELVMPTRSARVLSTTVQHPRVSRPPSLLPLPLRPLDTTHDLRLLRLEIEVPGLAAEFDGLTIAQVSDLHYDPRLGRRDYLRDVARCVNDLNADVVVFTGDFVNQRRLIGHSVRYHATMKGRLATLVVLGNHDYWTRPRRIQEECRRHGLRLMHNKRWTIERGGRRLVFAGTDAPWEGERSPWRTLLKRGPGDAVVLLSHTPDNAPVASRHGANLVLSGHNHGGQICLPLFGPIVVPSRYGHRFCGGVYDVSEDCVLVVSRGIGTSVRRGSGRVLCPPELILVTLRAPVINIAVPARRAPASVRREIEIAAG